ncbi:MAG: helix-turn-helix domain-containing protein [Pseudomonadota bacterium]|nr:helix-turn-helix domain-containing protein [Pseudomonadota bacterium]
MSETAAVAAAPGTVTAGRLLREARQAQGLHIAALASAIKVAPKKLELLESDRLDELPDATFARALAQTVCRSLKIDSGPILALLPRPDGRRLGHLGEGLNTPFRERPGRLEPSDWASIGNPALWGPALVLLAAGAVYLMPSGWFAGAPTAQPPKAGATVAAGSDLSLTVVPGPNGEVPSTAAPATGSVAAPSASGSAAGLGDPSAPNAAAAPSNVPLAATSVAPSGAAAPELPAPVLASTILQLHTSADSWIEVTDSQGRSLLSRLVKSGETVDVDGAVPMRLNIGNATHTEVRFRGEALDLAPFTHANLARLELK